MPKSSDLMSVAFTPSPALAQLVGPGPVQPPAAMKAVLRHVAEHQLWLIPGQSFRADATLRKALDCQSHVHLMELPRFLDAQLKRIPKEMEALRKKRKAKVAAAPAAARWAQGTEAEDPCLAFGEEALEGLQLDERNRSFLLSVGLPECGVPFIDFDAGREGEPFEVLSEGLRVLGTYGDGEEEDLCVCLDETTGGRVVLRDPEKEAAPVLMNSGVPELLECMIVYRDLLRERTEEEEEEPVLPKRLRTRAAKALKAQDPKAFRPGSFWYRAVHGTDGPVRRRKSASKRAPPRKKKTAARSRR